MLISSDANSDDSHAIYQAEATLKFFLLSYQCYFRKLHLAIKMNISIICVRTFSWRDAWAPGELAHFFSRCQLQRLHGGFCSCHPYMAGTIVSREYEVLSIYFTTACLGPACVLHCQAPIWVNGRKGGIMDHLLLRLPVVTKWKRLWGGGPTPNPLPGGYKAS